MPTLRYLIYATSLASLIFLSGCSKNIEEYNQPAAYWYTKMVESISNGNLEKVIKELFLFG